MLLHIPPGDEKIVPLNDSIRNYSFRMNETGIIVTVPVLYKEKLVGYISAIGDYAPFVKKMTSGGCAASRCEFLMTDSGIVFSGSNQDLGRVSVQSLLQMPLMQVVDLVRQPDMNFFTDNARALRIAIEGTNLFLIAVRTREGLYGQSASPMFFYLSAIFPVCIFLGIFMISKVNRMGVALLRGEQRFHAIFDNIKETVFVLKLDGEVIVEANASVRDVFGYEQEELPGLSVADFCSMQAGFTDVEWVKKMQEVAEDRPQVFEWYARRKDGGFFWLGVNARQAVIDDELRILVVVRDITRRKEQENELSLSLEYQRQLNSRLEEAQNQLLQSEKMASIGQLAAGVAHEINNPIGFVSSNLSTLDSYVSSILTLLDAYEDANPYMPETLSRGIAGLRGRIDIDYVRADIKVLLKESIDGILRVRKIVADLKDFSHVDQAEIQSANIEAGLDSTLNVVWNELKYKARVVKEYAGIPEMICMVGQLNQVFMNLLINAAQAIEDYGQIVIRTGFDDVNIWVEIEDDGCGISTEYLQRIFEPFFTTKPVGKGTGLGLSLSYGIIRKHHGEILVQSEKGKGTVFRVVLPRNGMLKEAGKTDI